MNTYKLLKLFDLAGVSDPRFIIDVLVRIYFSEFKSCNLDEIKFFISYKSLYLFKLIGFPKKYYKSYFLIIESNNVKKYKLITYAERIEIEKILIKLSILKDWKDGFNY